MRARQMHRFERPPDLHVECRRKGSMLVPVRFGAAGSEHEVAEALDFWPGEDHLYVKVRTVSGDLFILRHDTTRATWEIVLFREAGSDGLPASPTGSAGAAPSLLEQRLH